MGQMRESAILLVDDENTILSSLKRELTLCSYKVTTATNKEEAIEQLHKNFFDMVITDLVGVDGIEVLQEAKEIDSHMCVFILTGYGGMTTAIDALRLGADDYLLKPYDIEELLHRLELCLEKQRSLRKIKIYEEILPICMYCKDIRDDSGVEPGKGKWVKLETYLGRKSGTSLSHGLCPECFKEIITDVDSN